MKMAQTPTTGSQPMAMTKEQYEQLAVLFSQAHAATRTQTRLAQAAAGIDRCDGAVPESTRLWVRALDGWATEGVGDEFMLELAKSTTAGDLLDEIRHWCNTHPNPVATWSSLRGRILDHFLSACETIRLQTLLESSQQKSGETTPTYVRRFKMEAARAYPTARAASEENRVVGSFLRGLADHKFAESVFKSGRISTLAAATAVTLEKEAERERMEQMLRKQGHEVMEVGAAAATPATAAADQVVSLLETLQRRMERLTTKVAKMETRQMPAVSPRPTTTRGPKSGERRSPNWNRWADDGRPICNGCGKAGHMFRECPKRQQATTQTASPSQQSGGQ